jgi:hypothetical protein
MIQYIKKRKMDQGKRRDQIASAQLGLFIGFIGMLIVGLVAVVVDALM